MSSFPLSALFYLRWMSLRNRTVGRVKRLRQPKYLFSAMAGGAYIWFFFLRPVHGSNPELVPVFAALGSIFFLLIVVLGWVVPTTQPGLGFTEAETAFLFPAPMSRRTLVNFKLLGTQVTILLTSLFFALVTNRWQSLGGNAVTHALGWWVILSTLNLHSTAAALTLNHMMQRGVSTGLRRTIVLGGLGAVFVGTVFWLRRTIAGPTDQDVAGVNSFVEYLTAVVDTGPLHWLLWPFRTALAPFFAASVAEFFRTLGPALLLLAAHYYWVMRLTEVSFEEASIAMAEKNAAIIARARSGNYRIGAGTAKARRAPFKLAEKGSPAIAFLWKNLLSTRPYFTPRAFAICAFVIVFASRWFRADIYGEVLSKGAIVMGIATIFYVMMMGPQLARQDLRSDLTNADILKTYPIRGSQIVLGELLTPVAILTGIFWLGLLLGTLGILADRPNAKMATLGGPVILASCAAIITPLLIALQLLVVNSAAVVFPGWFQSSRNIGGGIEVMGQRLIFFFGNLLVMICALLPSAAGGLLAMLGVFGVAVARQFFGGPEASFASVPAIVLAAVVVLGVLVAEVWVGIRWLGRRFENFDLSAETRS